MKNIKTPVDDNIYLDILSPLLDNKMCNRLRSESAIDNITAIIGYTVWDPAIYPVRDRLRITLKQTSHEKH
jgi:hypothetical protein